MTRNEARAENPADQRPVALVTGAGAKRVGRHVADKLASLGYRLALHAHRSIDEARAAAKVHTDRGVESIALAADLRDESAVKRLTADVLAHFGRVDALVNTAAIWERKPLEQVTADDVRRHFDTNALATFLMCRHVGLAMAAQADGGAIVNLGDWATARPYKDYAAYFPSKGAVEVMTRSLAVELAARNPKVRVNAVLPGPVMLPAELPEAERRQAINGTLVKREGTPEHVAAAPAHSYR